MTQKVDALILAAGSGTRYLESGGGGLKQLANYRDEPVLRRMVRQLRACGRVASITVIIGEERENNEEIINALKEYDISYIENNKSRDDHNLISFYLGARSLDSGLLLLEADCVMRLSDIVGMTSDLHGDELRWSHIGDCIGFSHGGIIELNEQRDEVQRVAVMNRAELDAFKLSGRRGLKMFGITAFGARARAGYCEKIGLLADKERKYFHHIAIEQPEGFLFTAYGVSDGCFSFNTVEELVEKNRTNLP